MLTYEEAWSFLDNLQFFKIKLGLDSMAGFLQSFDNPHNKLQYVHIAGTNGKGSVGVTLLTLLSRAGYRVGLYTSPHLSSVRERFRINDAYISREDFAALAGRIHDILEGRQITYFEFTTVLALLWFVQENVDMALLEVGMGGRLDATNVVRPLVSVITNVSMDHEAYLGDTLEKVAHEKAGIIKAGVPVVTGVADDVGRQVVEETCRLRKAPVYLLGKDFSMAPGLGNSWNYHGLSDNGFHLDRVTLNLIGAYQADNTALALATLELLNQKGFSLQKEVLRRALKEVVWPGRLEYFCATKAASPASPGNNPWQQTRCPDDTSGKNGARRFLLDGAHNPAGVTSLIGALKEDFTYRRLILVWASMIDKDFSQTLALIAPLCDRIIFTFPEYERSARPQQLLEVLEKQYHERVLPPGPIPAAIDKAYETAGPADLICIAGSLYLIGAAREILLGELAP